jgi:hypothetical protein
MVSTVVAPAQPGRILAGRPSVGRPGSSSGPLAPAAVAPQPSVAGGSPQLLVALLGELAVEVGVVEGEHRGAPFVGAGPVGPGRRCRVARGCWWVGSARAAPAGAGGAPVVPVPPGVAGAAAQGRLALADDVALVVGILEGRHVPLLLVRDRSGDASAYVRPDEAPVFPAEPAVASTAAKGRLALVDELALMVGVEGLDHGWCLSGEWPERPGWETSSTDRRARRSGRTARRCDGARATERVRGATRRRRGRGWRGVGVGREVGASPGQAGIVIAAFPPRNPH